MKSNDNLLESALIIMFTKSKYFGYFYL